MYYSSSQSAAHLILKSPQNNLRKRCQQGVTEEKNNPDIREPLPLMPPTPLGPSSVGRHLSADERWDTGEFSVFPIIK
ncbi:hypothetical protein CEXT_401491 [Caerostris extrusa]|uniref:Ycf15 n=1 Tax=Caerostris extrusa TaxID=172846 RepID=A0AAV4NIZ9_CAEEX|nr:hypothetical protein CEXT_401491 [Caerostris extrusa]